jgi:RHS repeat-associated protein
LEVPETGLYFYRSRYYDSTAGRFLTRDPIGLKGECIKMMTKKSALRIIDF